MNRSEVLPEPIVQVSCGKVYLDIPGGVGLQKPALEHQIKGEKPISPPWMALMASGKLLSSSLAAPAGVPWIAMEHFPPQVISWACLLRAHEGAA